MSRKPQEHEKRPQSIFIEGRTWPVRGSLQLAGRVYPVLKELGGAHQRSLVFDRAAGPGGDLRVLHVYPKNEAVIGKLRRLKRLDCHFPMIIAWEAQRDRVLVLLTWIRGTPLDKYLEEVRSGRTPRPSATQAAQMVRGVAHGVGKLFARLGVIHGDIKPANLILSNDSTHLSLIDFGSAWVTERTVKDAGGGDGVTFDAYASPEQRRSDAFPAFASDVFSLSVVLYELLTVTIPYDPVGGGAGASEPMRAAYEKTLIKPSRLRTRRDPTPNAIWSRLDRLTMRGLALDPQARYPNRDEWLSDWDDIHALIRRKPAIDGVNHSLLKAVSSLRRFVDRLRGKSTAD